MMVPFQLSTLPSRRGKTAAERRAKSSAYPLQMPLFSGERVLPPCRRMALSPLSWRRPGHYSAGGAAATAVWREYRPTAGALAAVGFPGEWALSSVGIVAPGLDFNIMTQRGRASATVQVVSDLQCPASEGVAYVLQGEWDLAGRRCAAGSGLCWRGGSPRNLRPVGSNGRLLLAEIALK